MLIIIVCVCMIEVENYSSEKIYKDKAIIRTKILKD